MGPGHNAGFSTAEKTWLPVPPSSRTRNVSVQEADAKSILNFYKNLIRLRRSQPALRNGTYTSLNPQDSSVLSWLRRNPGDGDSVIVALNMSAEPRKASFDLKPQGIKQPAARPLLVSPGKKLDTIPLSEIELPPFGVFIGAVQ